MSKILIYTFLAVLTIVSFSSCLDDNSDEWDKYLEELEEQRKQIYEQYLVDSVLIVDYLAENDSLATFDEKNGIFYKIINPGNDNHPNNNSSIEVKYKGMLLDGTIFAQTKEEETVFYILGNLIGGWQIGVPKIGTDGLIILYLPSYYAYGTKQNDNVPANSVLIFEIELIGFY